MPIDRWPELCKLVKNDDNLPVREVRHWTEEKLWFWNRYLEITTTAMVGKPQWKAGLVYVDLFGGPGVLRLRNSGKRLPGDVDLRFAEDTPLEVLREDWRPYVFIDSATSGKIVFRQHWRRIVFEEFADSEDLTREIVGRCSPFMAERVRNDINDGAAIEFGPLILSRDGLTHRGRILPWLQIEEVRFEDDSVIVSQLGDVQEWCRVRVNDLLLRTVLQLVISDLLPGK